MTAVKGKVFLNKSDYASFSLVFISGHAAFSNYRCCLCCLFTVIGGNNVYLRLSVSGKCDDKDFIWRKLQKEVLYSVVLRIFKLRKRLLQEEKLYSSSRSTNTGRPWRCAAQPHMGRVQKGISSSCKGGPGRASPGKV